VPEVSLYVAVITAAAAIVGASLPLLTSFLRDERRAERDRRERVAESRRQICLDLLATAGELRTQVENAADYQGARMADLLAEIRRCAEAVRQNAAAVELLAPAKLGEPANRLAETAEKLRASAAEGTDLKNGQMVKVPSTAELAGAMSAFKNQARAELRS
jgi:hypothetical protein